MRQAYWELRVAGGRGLSRNPVVQGRKFCSKCGCWRHACNFGRQGDGLRGVCRKCLARRERNRRHNGGSDPLLPREPLLRELERRAGLYALARNAGVSDRTIRRIRVENKRVRLDTADRLAVAMGIPLSTIYPEH